MKKFFSILAAVLFAGSMMADSYTVTFKDAGEGKGDSSSSLTSSNVADYVAEGAEYFSAVAPTGKVYLGQGGYGLKFGNSSGAGSITLTLVTPVTPTSIVMNASPWSATEGEGLLQDSIFATKSTGAKGTFADFTYYYDGATQVTTIVVGTNTKRGYVKSITVNDEGGVTPPAVATPVISGEAEFTESTTVTITCSTEGVVLYYTLDGTEPNNNATAYNAPFSLTETATVKAIAYEQNGDQYSAVASKTFTKATPLPDPTNCAEAREAALSVSGNNVEYKGGQVYTIEGYVTAIQTAYSATNHNITFWMADTEDGGNVLEAYRAACASEEDAPAVGDKVAVTGKLTKYNTTPEFAAGCTFVITEKSAPATNLGEKTIAEFLELKNAKDTCILTGVVSNIQNEEYGNFDLVDETGSVYIYGLLTPEGEAKKFADLGVEAGDTLTVLAIYSEYNGTPQVKNAIFVDLVKGEGGGSEGEYSYDYEPGEVSTFNVEMTVAEMSDYTEDYGVVAIYFESEDGSYFASMELIISSADLVVPGAYQISDSEEEGTFYASPGGDEQYDYGCYFGVTYIDPEDGEEYYNPYYLVSGNVTITETGIQVQAKSYYGSTVNFTYEDKNDAVVNTKLTDKLLKAIENGNVIIKSGNVIFNVNGQRIK